ncbi:MAG: PEP-CTERM sorting domain-containing protein [Chthoniobacterales bacterium]
MKTLSTPVLCLRSLAWAGLASAIIANSPAAITTYISKFDQQAIEEAYTSGTTFLTDDFGTKAGNRGVFTSFTGSTTGITYTGTGSPQIQANDQYGGNGTGNYLGVASGAVVTATFAAPVEYFGLYISALDGNNVIKLYNGSTLLLTFNASSLTTLLPNNPTSTVRAIDNTLYNTDQYYGQPVTGSNASEPYAYVSFFATAGTKITSAVLSESVAIFETDNYSIRTTAPAVATSLVLVPEPGTTSLMILSGTALAWMLSRRRTA